MCKYIKLPESNFGNIIFNNFGNIISKSNPDIAARDRGLLRNLSGGRDKK